MICSPLEEIVRRLRTGFIIISPAITEAELQHQFSRVDNGEALVWTPTDLDLTVSVARNISFHTLRNELLAGQYCHGKDIQDIRDTHENDVQDVRNRQEDEDTAITDVSNRQHKQGQ